MNRFLKKRTRSFPVKDKELFKTKLLQYGCAFHNFILLDSMHYPGRSHFEWQAAIGTIKEIHATENATIEEMDAFLHQQKDELFGHISYDLKNLIESLHSRHFDGIRFPLFSFFVPEIIITCYAHELTITSCNPPEEIYENICNQHFFSRPIPPIQLQDRVSREQYFETVQQLLQHIARGDCYEICYCIESFARNAQIDPVSVYQKLNQISPAPFSAFYKHGEKYLLCASPERFLSKKGNTIFSQPIKGTAPRDLSHPERDRQLLDSLKHSPKERAENTMITDLVRNDLSKICQENSVRVDEYLQIYSYPQVHQMISTVSGELSKDTTFSDIIKATFPMGSMTGAPKVKALQLIEEYEQSARGMYSGSVGYINAEGDFDWNVVIRSIAYNHETGYVSLMAGSAITALSDPEKEYEECQLKMKAMKAALEQ